MSLMLLAWFSGFAILLVFCLKNPIWTIVLYFYCFFAFPLYWWWGNPVGHVRWSLIAGFILLLGVLIKKGRNSPQEVARLASLKRVSSTILIMFLVNATFVQFLVADDPIIGQRSYILLAKFVLLFFLMTNLISSSKDLKLISLALLLGASYIGFESTINERGHVTENRLEGIGAPGAAGANQLASLMVTILPVAGSLFLISDQKLKILIALAVPLVLNVVLLCNSRGGFLAAIFSGMAYLILSPSQIRKQTIFLLVLGAGATFMLLGDERIIERFLTIFVSDDQRDTSADHRLVFWQAGLNVIMDHPLGSGGYGFKWVHASKYIAEQGITVAARSVHNGFINEAVEMGYSGIIFKITLFSHRNN